MDLESLTREQQAELRSAIGRFGHSAENPNGVSFAYIGEVEKPFMYFGNDDSDSFATYEELLENTRAMYATLHQD